MMKRDMMRHRRKPLVRAMMALALLGGCAGALYFFGVAARIALLERASVPTRCTVLSSEVRSTEPLTRERGTQSSTVYYATVRFFHEVEGQRYEASDDGPNRSCGSGVALDCGDVRAKEDARDFTVGTEVPCIRARAAPSIAAVFPKEGGAFELIFGLGILALTVFAFLDERKYWKKP